MTRPVAGTRSAAARRSAAAKRRRAAKRPAAGAWFVYLVRCRDGSLYTGVTTDPRARVSAHNAGRGARYTRGRRPVALVHVEPAPGHGAALRRERAIKQWPRARKEALVAQRRSRVVSPRRRRAAAP